MGRAGTLAPMCPHTRSSHTSTPLTSFFWCGEAIRSRSVSHAVLTGRVNLPALPLRMVSDCDREISGRLGLEAGDVEALSLARARMRWPDYKLWVQAAADWIGDMGFPNLLADCEIALMACRGAKYHHDALQYGNSAFCNLFLSDDKGLDLHFPFAGQRIPLTRGTVVIFDTAQPHGVITQSATGFEVAEFSPERDCTLLFLTWELPIENTHLAHALGIEFDTEALAALSLRETQVQLNSKPVVVNPESGIWQ